MAELEKDAVADEGLDVDAFVNALQGVKEEDMAIEA